ncbi:MAG: exodeoxyribonuclease V subunit gamma, partial [Haemophilus parainfluenzae]|nr:exodeoxyribonuclease V subunit gamma [Haemophilus parainfluenzae]
IAEVMSARLEETPNSLRFLAGKVNFCTLLPMRSIPFKVVCLLGMNEADYPRSHTPNSFDLMQYHHQKGDRVRRDDDRYLFLEALLAARSHFYVSYVGCSIIDNQPKEPSVLVSQLVDYINHYSDDGLRIEQHPMTAFSPSNFQNEGEINRSFAKKWLPIAQFQERKCHEFVVPMGENQEPITEIELDRFVSFVENPVKFFFEKQLGVYFRDEDDRIEESENFILNGLDHHRISNELLHLEEAQFNDYFAKQRVKGIMPRGEFAEVCAQSIRADVLAFKEKIKDYSSPYSESVDFVVETVQGNIRLFGYMEPLFGDENQIIEKENALPPRIIAKDKDLTLKTIEKSTALEKLKMYVEAYLQSQQQIQLIPTENIAKFIEKDESAVNFDNVLTNIESLAKTDPYGYRKADPYWARVLWQTEQFKSQDGLLQLVKQTTSWFGEMLS